MSQPESLHGVPASVIPPGSPLAAPPRAPADPFTRGGPPGGPGKPGASTLSMVSAGLGVGGLGLTFFGCCCGLLAIVGVPMGIAAVVLGYLEWAKIKRGEEDTAGEPWAMVGMATGAVTTFFGLMFAAAMALGMAGNATELLEKLKAIK